MPLSHTCPICFQECRTQGGLTKHKNSHREITPDADPLPRYTYAEHPKLTGRPCRKNGVFLDENTPPNPPQNGPDPDEPWNPFEDRVAFDFAYKAFVEDQGSIPSITKDLGIWAASLLKHGESPPWSTAQEMYETIDAIQYGPAPWRTITFRYEGEKPENAPKWMLETYTLCVRDTRLIAHSQLATSKFRKDTHYAPYNQFDTTKGGERVWSNLLSGDWSWEQADLIAADPSTHGSMFVPIIIGSDKTTVSVATGHQQYHPVYMSLGNFSNTARRAHINSVLPVAFLPIPKASKKQRKRRIWQRFSRQLYHACLEATFLPLKPWMTAYDVVQCPDEHFRRAIYGLGPYIADYPEQVWLAGIVQGWCPKCLARPENLDGEEVRLRREKKTDFLIKCFDPGILWDGFGIRADVVPFTHNFPRADIHQLLAPDLLHQVIKGVFKDHLITWVNEYLVAIHGEARALEIIQDIDRRIAAVPAFPGLRRFPDGRDFQQWTGDDSKALMKVYLGAVVGYIPNDMIRCLAAFLDFAYLARRNALSTSTLEQLEAALNQFIRHREAFENEGIRTSLPRQHSLQHYLAVIRLFGSPNGLCSSITESRHITAVKEPWRRSNRYNALIQMLRTIERIDKLDMAKNTFGKFGMMEGSTLSYTAGVLTGEIIDGPLDLTVNEDDGEDWEDDIGPVTGPRSMSDIFLAKTADYSAPLDEVATRIEQPRFPEVTRRFLWSQRNPDSPLSPFEVPAAELPLITGHIRIYNSAVLDFYAPSDLCGAGGMKHERIRSNPSWFGGDPRRDTVFVETDAEGEGMLGLTIARVLLFFSFVHGNDDYDCALVHWLKPHGDRPDPVTNLWVVCPEYSGNGRRTLEVISIKAIACAAHLIPAFGVNPLPEDFKFSWSLDVFHSFYVNSYADHHTHELIKV